MKSIPFFQKQNWFTAIARVLALVLTISLALPSFAAHAAGLEGAWQLVDSPITLELSDGDNFGRMYCNSYFGSYEMPLDVPPGDCDYASPIRFGQQFTTYVGCAENQLESQYLLSLQSTQAYQICDDMLILQSFPEPLKYHKMN
ncbi:MAG: META domain-containing protein [Cyanobacteria bacterium SBLK]|nr:META domain-containing protein [Cyanobacteria bacterium SBLK]